MAILIRELTAAELPSLSLSDFDRAETGDCIAVSDGFERRMLPMDYEEPDFTDAQKKRIVTIDWRNCIYGLGKVLAAFDEGKIVGFCEVWNAHVGLANDASDISRIHVSAPYRRQGIGTRLMREAERITKEEFHMKRVYISAHRGAVTQRFLDKMGFSPALDVAREHTMAAPDEIQMDKKPD